MRIVVALGGNALLHRGERPEQHIQTHRLAEVAPHLATVANDHELVIVHGNGPQVGLLSSENRDDPAIGTAYPLGDMVAESQGLIGLWIQQALHNAGALRPVVTLVCQTLVDAADPAWLTPTKFIGPNLTPERADSLRTQLHWSFADDGGTPRRVVASPSPLAIIERDVIGDLLTAGVTVIAGGGGGVPVIRQASRLIAADAVVDKDAVAALLATELEADLLVILTDVPAVMANYGTSRQRAILGTTAGELGAASFAAGSMGPKVDAAVRFVTATTRRAAIGSLDNAAAVIAGTNGTQIGC